jgi:hypothetical protein
VECFKSGRTPKHRFAAIRKQESDLQTKNLRARAKVFSLK